LAFSAVWAGVAGFVVLAGVAGFAVLAGVAGFAVLAGVAGFAVFGADMRGLPVVRRSAPHRTGPRSHPQVGGTRPIDQNYTAAKAAVPGSSAAAANSAGGRSRTASGIMQPAAANTAPTTNHPAGAQSTHARE